MARRSSPELVPALPVLGLFESGRTTPLRLGITLALAMIGLRLVVLSAFGRLHLPTSDEATPLDLREARIGLVLALAIGYGPAAYGWGIRSLRAALDALRPAFGRDLRPLDEAAALAGLIRPGARRLWIAIGLGIAFGAPFLVDRNPALYLDPRYWRPETFLNWVQLPFVGCLLTCALRSLWEDAQRLSRVAESLLNIDLLDARALTPFGRQALRIALLTIVVPSIFAILVSDQGFAELLGALAVSSAVVATTAFLLPVRGIHRRIVQEKEAELTRVRAALRGNEDALGKSGLAAFRARATAADLLAYEARIEAVREWPFDVSTLARFAALLLLPLGSWLGGALVEHVVSRILD